MSALPKSMLVGSAVSAGDAAAGLAVAARTAATRASVSDRPAVRRSARVAPTPAAAPPVAADGAGRAGPRPRGNDDRADARPEPIEPVIQTAAHAGNLGRSAIRLARATGVCASARAAATNSAHVAHSVATHAPAPITSHANVGILGSLLSGRRALFISRAAHTINGPTTLWIRG